MPHPLPRCLSIAASICCVRCVVYRTGSTGTCLCAPNVIDGPGAAIDTLRRHNERGHMNDTAAEPQNGQAYLASVEEVLHNAGIEVRKIAINPQGDEVTLLRFHTPAKIYTVKLDDGGVNTLLAALRGTDGTPDILIAQPGDVPGLGVR